MHASAPKPSRLARQTQRNSPTPRRWRVLPKRVDAPMNRRPATRKRLGAPRRRQSQRSTRAAAAQRPPRHPRRPRALVRKRRSRLSCRHGGRARASSPNGWPPDLDRDRGRRRERTGIAPEAVGATPPVADRTFRGGTSLPGPTGCGARPTIATTALGAVGLVTRNMSTAGRQSATRAGGGPLSAPATIIVEPDRTGIDGRPNTAWIEPLPTR
jgi:hypothetical protein